MPWHAKSVAQETSDQKVAADRPSGSPLMIRDLSVAYGPHEILKSLSLTVAAGETLVILGESGCGKTSLLKAIAGTVTPTRGQIQLAGVDITSLPPAQRGIVYLDQDPLLFEHLTIEENLAFSLRLRREPAERIEAEVTAMLAALDLQAHRHKREWQVSGGQKQRIAFGRAVLARPRLLLLDEPFCSLDGKTRTQMQTLFATVVRERRLTSLFVTHDVKESLLVGDTFARLESGSLRRYDTREVFKRDPATGIPAEIAFWNEQSQRKEARS